VPHRFTDLVRVAHPVMNAGMGHVAVPQLVAAVSRAGGLGMLATSTLSPAEVRQAIAVIRRSTDQPFGANVTLAYPYAVEIAEVLLDERVAVLNLSMGAAPVLVERAHGRGIVVMASVTTLRHARRAARDGVDLLVATGHEAAGHGSTVSTAALVPAIVREIATPVVAAGGFTDPGGLGAARALGACAISIGTRFALSAESPIHPVTRDVLLAADAESTVVTDRIDGYPSRVLARGRALSIARGDATPGETVRAVREGRLDEGVVACGQIVGAISEVVSCADIIARLVAGR
jgi:enoyl-[acyl-carrier protein] reductase II